VGLTLILALISGISGSLTNLLSSSGVISAGLSSLINASVAAGVALFDAIKSGGTTTNVLQASLTALQAEYTAIQKDTSADPAVIGAIAEVSNLLNDAIAGWDTAQTVDPGTLPAPPPVE
jgi:hypothetical protein